MWIRDSDNTHRAFELCDLISDPKFEMVSNGIMINCFPEGMISSYVELLKIIKDYWERERNSKVY